MRSGRNWGDTALPSVPVLSLCVRPADAVQQRGIIRIPCIRIQAVRTPHRGSTAGGPLNLTVQGKSGRTFQRPVEQLLVEYYLCAESEQRLEREPEQWQREQQQ